MMFADTPQVITPQKEVIDCIATSRIRPSHLFVLPIILLWQVVRLEKEAIGCMVVDEGVV